MALNIFNDNFVLILSHKVKEFDYNLKRGACMSYISSLSATCVEGLL